MDTPICDFVHAYQERKPLRFHMPGHKGDGPLGVEELDLTEIEGADVLYHSYGIIRRSEENAARLFGTGRTVFSTEGSSLCIRAMVQLAQMYARAQGRTPLIAAGRNVHRTFMTACALLDVEVAFFYPKDGGLLSCPVEPKELEDWFASPFESPTAVYITAPDYLGHMQDVAALAKICHAHNVLLLVDNAHGAYLRFLPESLHPMDLGADLCCDSAHKTLPALTGGAYLHISKNAPAVLNSWAEDAMALFASTSPSYLILQSLDAVNFYLAGDYREKLARFERQVAALKSRLSEDGWALIGEEPLKLTLCPKKRGWTGEAIAKELEKENIFCEFADPDFLVLMLAPEQGTEALEKLETALANILRRPSVMDMPPLLPAPPAILPLRQAMLSPYETLPAEAALGRVCASPTVSCPPAVPIVMAGETVTSEALELFRYYGIETVNVVKK